MEENILDFFRKAKLYRFFQLFWAILRLLLSEEQRNSP